MQAKSHLRAVVYVLLVTAGIPLVSPSVRGAETSSDASSADAGDAASLAEIVVTAEKRTQRVQDVPMSITVSTASQLQALGITNTDQLEKAVPGFSVDKTVYGSPVFLIRGIGFNDTSLGVSPAVTVYMDQVPLPFSAMTRGAILDLERVEVLKGPQGTLFGENSTGGAINYIAAKPTDSFQAGTFLSYGRFNQSEFEGFISGPLSNTVTARFAYREEYGSDWQKGYTLPETNGERRFHNGRLLLDWAPSGVVKFELMLSGWLDKSDTQQPQDLAYTPLVVGPAARPVPYPVASYPPAPNDPRAAAWYPGDDFEQNNSLYQAALRGDIKLSDAITLTSISSYEKYRQEVPIDWSGSVYPVARSVDNGWISSVSQELRLDGSTGERTRWMLGGNFEHDIVDEHQEFGPIITSGTSVGPFNFDTFDIDNDQGVTSKSGFGSLDFKLTDEVTSQTSVRFTQQDRHFSGCTRDSGDGELATAIGFLGTILTGVPQNIAPGSCAVLGANGAPVSIVTGDLDQSNVSWRESINWKPTRDMLAYANATKGFKAGSFPTQPSAAAVQFQPVRQESVLAYELGLKYDTPARVAQINAAAFYYDYKDKQLAGYLVVPPFGSLPQLVSIPRARVGGGEMSVDVHPIEPLTASASVTYVDTDVEENPPNPTGPYGNGADFRGQPFPYTPKWQAVLGSLYRQPLGNGLRAFFGPDVTMRSATNAALLSGAASVAGLEGLLKIHSYTLLDLRAGVEPENGPWRVELWGRNVANRRYSVGTARTSDFTTEFTGMPATFGISASYRFGR
jgi:iron complex outermembrane recepter protein